MRYIFVLLAGLVLLSGVLLAQSITGNEALPECTPSQADSMVRILAAAGVTPQLENVREEEDSSTLFAMPLFDGYMKVLRDYDEDFKSRLPDCALAVRFESALYRLAAAKGYWYGAAMAIEAGADDDDFLRLEEIPLIVDSATEEVDTLLSELVALAEDAE